MGALAARDGFAGRLRYGAAVTAVRTIDAAGEETVDDDAAVAVRLGLYPKFDCHLKKTATGYYRKPGLKWLSCTVK
jgi:hypothetical protein